MTSALAVAALAMIAPIGSARAATVTDMTTFGSSTNPLTVPFTLNLTLHQFDTTLGTLTSVQFILSQTATLTASVGNFSGATTNYSSVTGISIVTVSGAGLSTAATSSIGPYAGADSTLGAFVQVGTGTSTSGSSAFVNSANLASYEGTGSGTYSVEADAMLGAGGSANRSGVAYMATATNYGTLEVIYTYAPAAVPEPASLGMLGLGLGGLAVARLRRRNA